MAFAVSVTTKFTSTPSLLTLPGATSPPMRKVRPCGASLAATCDGVKKNTMFLLNATSTSDATTPSATTPSAMAAMRLCRGFMGFFVRCASDAQAGSLPARAARKPRRTSPRRRGHTPPWRKIHSFPLQDDAAHAHQRDRDTVHPERSRHHDHAGEHRRRHAGGALQAHRRTLVEGVPPLDRVIDDRDVDHADDREHRAGAVGAPRLVDRRLQRHEAEVEEEQDQLGSETG